MRYENGYSDYLEVLDTERSLFSAQLQLASARGDYQRALVNLYRALGRRLDLRSSDVRNRRRNRRATIDE